MSQWYSQDFLCSSPNCSKRFNQIILRVDREKNTPCEKCGVEAKPVFSVPRNLRASFHDGVKRKGFQEGHEAANLESEMFNHPVEERAPIQKEIDKLRKADT